MMRAKAQRRGGGGEAVTPRTRGRGSRAEGVGRAREPRTPRLPPRPPPLPETKKPKPPSAAGGGGCRGGILAVPALS